MGSLIMLAIIIHGEKLDSRADPPHIPEERCGATDPLAHILITHAVVYFFIDLPPCPLHTYKNEQCKNPGLRFLHYCSYTSFHTQK
jgi:hypothetical protein